jgi:RNA polymerase sigma factor (sigma-70 family)
LGRNLSASVNNALLLKVSKGDDTAFGQLYDAYGSFVRAVIRKYISDEDERNEITQQVFIALWERREGLSDVKSFDDYLFIVTRNKVFKYFSNLRKEALILKELQNHDVPEPQSSGLNAELREYHVLWERAMQMLPAQQKQVYTLIERHEETVDHVAKELGLARGTVKKHLELARKAVRKFISNELEGGRSVKAMVPLAIVALFIF